MVQKLGFRKKLFLYLSLLLVVFTIFVLIYQFQREKGFRKRQLENTLENFTELSYRYIQRNSIFESEDFQMLDSIMVIIPIQNLRLTVISSEGVVLYDSEVSDYEKMENHLMRPEVQESLNSKFGTTIRESTTTGNRYYYYTKHYTNLFIRIAALYDIQVRDFLKVEKLFIVYLVSLFIFIWIILILLTKNLGRTITKLKEFTLKLSTGREPEDIIDFPDDELGSISKQMISMYDKLHAAKDKILVEKSKLDAHLQTLNEGIAFYSSDKRIMLKNKPFIQYLNLISSKSNLSEEQIFEVKEFKPVIKFVDKQLNSPLNISSDLFPHMEYDLISNDRYFNIRCAFYEDKSFEILIRDNTKLEKRRLIKQQLTSNIAHELKTPVATIMGYMETLQGNGISPKKQKYFIEKAFSQTKRLSELVEDISLLSRIEEAKDHFKLSEVDVNLIIEEVTDSLELKLNEKNINVQFHPRRPIIINGNNSLLFSIFYNLFDNVINYGGENIQVNISQYLEDRKYYYISFSNSGNSIDKKHLTRIFERFYRIDAGRSRKKGGTGLGLAIVKNAVQFHKGEITAKKLKGGGVEFLFTLSKK